MNVSYLRERVEIPNADRQGVQAARPFPMRTGGFMPPVSSAALSVFPPDEPATSPRRVLLVDDNDPVRETLADLLESEGFQTVQAIDAAQAIMLMRSQPGFDVLVTDLSMPGADGITLIHQARQLQPALPAILLTGYAEQVTSVAVVAGGSFHVLRKPIEGDRLVEQISVLVRRPRQD
nr:response regulator [uncultured Rhodopila sp.]